MQKHIVIVDDDLTIRELLSDCLVESGFRSSACTTAAELEGLLGNGDVDLVVVDLNLAGEDGLDIVKQVAQMETIPVVIMTGERIEEADKAIGLEFGADDYIEKPFGLREFIARIGVCLRRPLPNMQRRPERIFRFSGWSLNMRLRSLHDPAGVQRQLTSNEFRVLSTFVQSPQTILSRDQLSRARDPNADSLDARCIDVVVNRLRRKLEGDCQSQSLIETERGVGYYFVPSVQQSDLQSWSSRLADAHDADHPPAMPEDETGSGSFDTLSRFRA